MEVLRSAILDMLRRKKDECFTSSDVVQQMYPEDWEQFLEEVNAEAMELYREGLITIQIAKTDTEDSLKISSPKNL
ncbi:uncharacterized protein DUF3253 [Algoriphagus ratkowskyi]|uniref:DUF3253 domain-containing protein n=1 Tax=Algoriphagus ratkowskyi TaxID=57028 RepID=A0A2W7S138_9BACT|nr:DUF3253 domain-containing protein [Algoriphagus ratkowskyi]PZX56845.1 uncharacterized protein DUF3253 [Algoriphagus ratkowskyi]TXD79760.1 DUF3253 domain-containing protein [Algoriphagus ratkowskyi]